MASDKKHILNCIVNRTNLELEPKSTDPMYDQLNARLRGRFSSSTYVNSVANAEFAPNKLMEDQTLRTVKALFRSSLAAAPLTQLVLSFEGIKTFTDQEAIALAGNLPLTLEVLVLNCRGSSVTDVGIDFLSTSAMGLQRLQHARIRNAKGMLSLSISHAP